jgi:NADH:ubiquinone oxidoreductase subunit 4 (subunit M)
VAFILILTRMLPDTEAGDWTNVIQVVAVLTMIVGNLIALAQDNVKRMLAYSSIAHAGYLMVGLAAGTAAGYSGVLYYLFAYTLMNVGAFGVIAYYERNHGLDFTEIDSYAGLGFKVPVMGVMLSVFLFLSCRYSAAGRICGQVLCICRCRSCRFDSACHYRCACQCGKCLLLPAGDGLSLLQGSSQRVHNENARIAV